jgi:hypothetical protein
VIRTHRYYFSLSGSIFGHSHVVSTPHIKVLKVSEVMPWLDDLSHLKTTCASMKSPEFFLFQIPRAIGKIRTARPCVL